MAYGIRKIDVVVSLLVLVSAISLLIDAFVWEEIRGLKRDLGRREDEIRELIKVLEAYRDYLTPPPISSSRAIEIVSEYTGWSMSYLRKYNASAVLWYVKITNSTTMKGIEAIERVLKPVSDYRPRPINENETLCYVWIVTIHDPKLKYPVPHGVNWVVNAYNGEVIDIFLHG